MKNIMKQSSSRTYLKAAEHNHTLEIGVVHRIVSVSFANGSRAKNVYPDEQPENKQ